MRISDWSSDVCSSDLLDSDSGEKIEQQNFIGRLFGSKNTAEATPFRIHVAGQGSSSVVTILDQNGQVQNTDTAKRIITVLSNHMKAKRSEEHTSELQSLMHISYAGFCLKKKKY